MAQKQTVTIKANANAADKSRDRKRMAAFMLSFDNPHTI
jgi:hypothetical protein